MDALTGGLPRGCLTEICGPASSGRTTVLLAALAAATRRGEFCAVVDASDALDPQSAAAAGVELERLLWVRCGESSPQNMPGTTSARDGPAARKRRLRTDRPRSWRSAAASSAPHPADHVVPFPPRRGTYAYRAAGNRAAVHRRKLLFVINQAGSSEKIGTSEQPMDSQCLLPTHAQLLTELEITAELVRSRHGSQTGSFRRDHIRQQNRLGGMNWVLTTRY